MANPRPRQDWGLQEQSKRWKVKLQQQSSKFYHILFPGKQPGSQAPKLVVLIRPWVALHEATSFSNIQTCHCGVSPYLLKRGCYRWITFHFMWWGTKQSYTFPFWDRLVESYRVQAEFCLLRHVRLSTLRLNWLDSSVVRLMVTVCWPQNNKS